MEYKKSIYSSHLISHSACSILEDKEPILAYSHSSPGPCICAHVYTACRRLWSHPLDPVSNACSVCLWIGQWCTEYCRCDCEPQSLEDWYVPDVHWNTPPFDPYHPKATDPVRLGSVSSGSTFDSLIRNIMIAIQDQVILNTRNSVWTGCKHRWPKSTYFEYEYLKSNFGVRVSTPVFNYSWVYSRILSSMNRSI